MTRMPTENEVQEAVALLMQRYRIRIGLVKQLIGEEKLVQLENVKDALHGKTMTEHEFFRIAIVDKGSMLFSGSLDATRSLRQALLRELDDDVLIALYERNKVSGKNITSPSYMPKALAEKRWVSGSKWAHDFVKTLQFPRIFAGIATGNNEKQDDVIDIEPRRRIPSLIDYQITLKEQMKEVLEREGVKTRCLVTLPTGGGKTRIAVESFIEWLQPRFSEGKYMIWIAQSEELCEQAIACIADMWQDREFVDALRVYRYFNGSSISEDELSGGVVVGSIQQIVSRIKRQDVVLDEILLNCGAMIIDEAHHAVAKSYNVLIDRAKALVGEELFPICGLSATPGRSMEQTNLLVSQFEANLLRPTLPNDQKYNDDPLLYFQEEGYLAKPEYYLFKEKPVLVDAGVLDEEGEISGEFLRVLANNPERNLNIIRYLRALPNDSSVLVYACTVDHAEFLAMTMNVLGYTAGYVSANTPKQLRRMYIQAFKEKKIQFLFNYGVLTTGFDAPKVDHLVICRPTSSVVLYEQMVGRGLRGKKFGGTDSCKVIDFSSNIKIHGKPLAYERFTNHWEVVEEECVYS